MTGPRSDPTWTVPDGVFESFTTWGPESLTRSASSSAQSCSAISPTATLDAVAPRLARRPPRPAATPSADRSADADDLVREVAGRHLHDDLLALLLAQQRATDGALVRDPALGRLGLGGPDDREGRLAVGTLDVDRRADLDMVGRVMLVDDRGVLDQRFERLDAALDEGLLVLGVLVLGVLREVAVLLRIVDPLGDLGPLHGRHLVELHAKLLEAVLGEVGGLVVHAVRPPRCRWV